MDMRPALSDWLPLVTVPVLLPAALAMAWARVPADDEEPACVETNITVLFS